ncbi:hypothetical protein COV28_01130 [candidate division WWE3 bacterium CG10_big_fil_rev_8_21_14_0_10_48_23]|nr:MAG: hypothetical protein COV28_01130 [candidate division WWE3 bacterium CG10_big_fil_rev_8_21_14_0_10_48_23]
MNTSEQEFKQIVDRIAELESFVSTYEHRKEALERFVELKTEEFKKKERELAGEIKKNQKILNDVKELRKQYSSGFPLLAKAYSEYFKVLDHRLMSHLVSKKYPALKAADTVREMSRLRREAVEAAKTYEYLIEYYETLFPFLVEVKGEVLDEIAASETLREYTEEEREDRVTWYVTKEEYRKLSTTEKNQLALDRYWDRRKTKRGIGNLYERYVGYLYEKDGYDVEYTGILSGFEDLGRDLITRKGNEIVVIQCKYWSQFKKIYENHIFQFFGTVYRYKFDYPDKKVSARFYTKTELSELARSFAHDLKIELFENFELEKYPCIKCNVARHTGEKIYHLPFDQQYDTTIVEPARGEFYAMAVKEAEDKGFRRAWRWRGELDKEKQSGSVVE